MAKTYYCISDLHIGGDEALGVCDFEDELVAFLDGLTAKDDEEVELIILGDAFGLWEFTQIEGAAKIDAIISQFPRIFSTFKRVGETVTITLLPGNHDYELACFPEFVDKLAKYNVNLEQSVSITRELGTHRIWVEHGNQYDEANQMPDFGNPHAQPIGYYITGNFVSSAGQMSERGRYNWLKDIQSVYPTEDIPHWVFSNYIYREMSPVLRWALLPFLLLFGLTTFVLIAAGLEALGVLDSNIFLDNRLLETLGIFGSILQLILTINAVLLATGLVLAIPLELIVKDLKRTADRFGLPLDPSELTGEKEDQYLDAARKVFEADPSVAVFVYGHTHKPSVRQVNDRVVVNTGTWIKRFNRARPRFGLLPQIYMPWYCLNYFRIGDENGQIVIDYQRIDKTPPDDLTLLERLMASRRRRESDDSVPERTVVQ